MHVSNKQKWCVLRVMCEMRLVWKMKMPCYIVCAYRGATNITCRACLSHEHWLYSLYMVRFLLCWYFVSQMLHLYSLRWNKNTHFFKILYPTFYMLSPFFKRIYLLKNAWEVFQLNGSHIVFFIDNSTAKWYNYNFDHGGTRSFIRTIILIDYKFQG